MRERTPTIECVIDLADIIDPSLITALLMKVSSILQGGKIRARVKIVFSLSNKLNLGRSSVNAKFAS